jgi:WD40 repeat protein
MPLRVFISSPGDVIPERRRAQLVIDKLAKSYARFFAIEPILWEVEPMLASGHFQDQIVPPGETDIVVLIVWSRLGTPLPERTPTREYHGIDGRVPVTGTEWEFEDALAAQKQRGAPDLLAYRKQVDPVVSLRDKAAKAAAEAQWEKLDTFWSRWFVDRGEFRAAFSDFTDLDGFEEKLERDLRALIERRIGALRQAGEGEPAPAWHGGSPFRGLDSYRFEHAPIFFGRSAMTRAAVEQVTANAESGRAFLLILGASGAGKSSLAQAGALPALVGRGIVPGVGLWRRAVMRPGGQAAGPFAALAEALADATALPELLAGRQDVAALARHLRASVDDPAFSIVAALNQIEEAARARGELLAIETARFALVVDQLEELFTAAETAGGERAAFVRCLDGLARSGRVYVLATMRSDYWHRAAETPLLVEMAGGTGRLDLLPATQDEIIEMIRQPAEAAGLAFDTDPVRGIGLDATLASEAASEPGALPLLSFLLDELYKRDIRDGRSTLTHASMHALGGLTGAIADRAEAAFADVPADVQAAMPRVLRALVTVSRAGAEPTARPALLAQFAAGSSERRLTDALLAARLLVADRDGSEIRVRLAHEALITHWKRAQDQVAQDRDDLRTRAVIEEALAEYHAAPAGRQSKRLLRDPQLANASDLAARWSGEFDAETLRFIQASRRRAHLMQRLIATAAAIFAAVAIFAGWQSYNANRLEKIAIAERDRANQKSNEADQKRAEAEQNLATAQVAQSEFLASTASHGHDDPGTAMLLGLEALPDSRAANARPYVPEAERELFGAWLDFREQRLREMRVLVAGARLFIAAFSADGQRLVTASADKTARIWDPETGATVQVLAGHEARSAAFSPDGRQVVTASEDRTARIWDAGTGRTIVVLQGHAGAVLAAVFSPDGRRVVTASVDKTARIWDVATGRTIAVLEGHRDSVYSAAFSPDGRHVATASADQTARIWDAESGATTAVLAGHGAAVLTAVFSPDGWRVVTASGDKTARIWDAAIGTTIAVLAGHAGMVMSAAFNADGSRVVTASADKTARIWDTATAKAIAVLVGHRNVVWSAAFSPKGQRVATASYDGTARIWDADTGGAILPLQGHADDIKTAVFSPDGRRVVTASADRTARIWDAEAGATTAVLKGHEGPVWSAAFSSDSRRVVTSSRDGTARIWDAETGSEIKTLQGHGDQVSTAVFSADGRRVVTASEDRTARIWDAETGRTIEVLQGHEGPVRRAVFSPDGRRVVTASVDKTARIWDVASGSTIAVLAGHSDSVLSAGFSPDGRRVITASYDHTARIWDAETGTTVAILQDDEAMMSGVVFSPDGRRVMTASYHAARIWDAETGRPIAVLDGGDAAELSAAFSPDGRRVVTGSSDKAARVWDAETGRVLAVMPGDAQVWSAAFSPDGRRVLTMSGRTPRIWRVFATTQDLVDEAKNVIPRCLTREQRTQAFLDPAPLDWCIEMEKWPYQSQDWKDWLRFKRANANPPLPDSAAWKDWIATHR